MQSASLCDVEASSVLAALEYDIALIWLLLPCRLCDRIEAHLNECCPLLQVVVHKDESCSHDVTDGTVLSNVDLVRLWPPLVGKNNRPDPLILLFLMGQL